MTALICLFYNKLVLFVLFLGS